MAGGGWTGSKLGDSGSSPSCHMIKHTHVGSTLDGIRCVCVCVFSNVLCVLNHSMFSVRHMRRGAEGVIFHKSIMCHV